MLRNSDFNQNYYPVTYYQPDRYYSNDFRNEGKPGPRHNDERFFPMMGLLPFVGGLAAGALAANCGMFNCNGGYGRPRPMYGPGFYGPSPMMYPQMPPAMYPHMYNNGPYMQNMQMPVQQQVFMQQQMQQQMQPQLGGPPMQMAPQMGGQKYMQQPNQELNSINIEGPLFEQNKFFLR